MLSEYTISQSIIDDINNNSSDNLYPHSSELQSLTSFMGLSEGMSSKTAELSKLSAMMSSMMMTGSGNKSKNDIPKTEDSVQVPSLKRVRHFSTVLRLDHHMVRIKTKNGVTWMPVLKAINLGTTERR